MGAVVLIEATSGTATRLRLGRAPPPRARRGRRRGTRLAAVVSRRDLLWRAPRAREAGVFGSHRYAAGVAPAGSINVGLEPMPEHDHGVRYSARVRRQRRVTGGQAPSPVACCPPCREALDALLGNRRSGDPTTDLVDAARESMRRREENSKRGAAVIPGLREQGLSWREIERRTGIPHSTAERWGTPPPRYTEGGEQP